MKFENTQVWGFEHAIRGMRNPKNSWSKSDSIDCRADLEEAGCCFCDDEPMGRIICDPSCGNTYMIGKNDLKLMQTLVKSGPEHRKFMRQIFVSVDITAPLFWWKEFDTYKIGTVANSTSTMHKMASKAITLDCFEIDDFNNIEYPLNAQRADLKYPIDNCFVQMCLIPYLEYLRQQYLATKDKKIWKELIRWLPESWLQTRTVTMNYENLLTMCSTSQRRFHKLNEWSGGDNPNLTNFISWARTLPYAQQLIFLDEVGINPKQEEEAFIKGLTDICAQLGVTVKNTDGSYRNPEELTNDLNVAWNRSRNND